MATVKPIPDRYHTITPYLYIKGAAEAIKYYEKVFGATESVAMPGPGGKIMHAELKIGDSIVMLAEENRAMGALIPATLGGSPFLLHIYVTDVDAVTKKAVDAGAKLIRPVKDQFYGDRTGTVIDPFGHVWNIGTHVEDVSPDEMRKRMAAMSQSAGAGA
jgi:PhnB protein